MGDFGPEFLATSLDTAGQLPALVIEPPSHGAEFFPSGWGCSALPPFISTSGAFSRKKEKEEREGFDVFKVQKSLGCSSRAIWQQVQGVTAGGEVGGWNVTAQP